LSSPYVYRRNGRRYTCLLHSSYHDNSCTNWNQGIQLDGYLTRIQAGMRNPPLMSTRLCILIYHRRTNRYSISQLFNRCDSSRHLLCSSTFSLCPIYGGCIRDIRWLHPLIPPFLRHRPPPPMIKGTILHNVHRS